jgi:hypothetical protein
MDIHKPYFSTRYILILSFHLSLGLSSSIFPLGFTTRFLYAFISHFPLARYMPHPSYQPWSDNPYTIWWRIQIMELPLNNNANTAAVNDTYILQIKFAWTFPLTEIFHSRLRRRYWTYQLFASKDLHHKILLFLNADANSDGFQRKYSVISDISPYHQRSKGKHG